MDQKIAHQALQDLIKKIKESPPLAEDVLHFILFGSLARGTYSEESDIDVLCVVKHQKENLYPLLRLSCEIERKYQCKIIFSLLIIDKKLFDRIQAGKATLSDSIQKEGQELWAA